MKNVFISILFLASVGFAQHFETIFVGNPYMAMTIYPVTATVDGVGLEAGDEIAIFDGENCVGVTVLTGPVTPGLTWVAAGQDDPDAGLSGFISGNPILYRFWDMSSGSEITDITADYIDNQGNPIEPPVFQGQGDGFVNLSGTGGAPTNHPPIAEAGSAQTVSEGDLVALDGSGSYDEDGDALTYLWTAPGGITLDDETAVAPTFTAPEVEIDDVDYTFTLVVNDGQEDSGADEVTITVMDVPPPNEPPVADAGADVEIVDLDGNGMEEITLDGSGSYDSDGTIASYSWNYDGGEIGTEATVTYTFPIGMHTITLTVTDDQGDANSDDVFVTVIEYVEEGHFTFHSGSQENYLIIVESALFPDGITELTEYDEIGVFTQNGLCVGGVFWGGANTQLTAWKDDFLTEEVDGYEDGDIMSFKIWNAATQTEYESDMIFSAGDNVLGVGYYSAVGLTAIGIPQIDVEPLNLNFGDVVVDDTANSTFTITNNGDGNLDVSSITSDNAAFTVNPEFATVVAFGGSVNITVTFAPDADGLFDGIANIVSDAGDVSVALTGNGISTPPTALFTFAPATGYAEFTTFTFTNATVDYGTGTDATFSWDFDGDSVEDAVGEGPHNFVYDVAGTYTASLTIVTSHGEASATQDVVVLATAAPDPLFSIDPATGYAGFTEFAFANITVDYGTGTDATFAWNFGDGSNISTDENPTHLYATDGIYTVTFTVTTTHGSNSVTQDLEVLAPVAPTALFTADPTSGYAPLEVNFTNTSELGTGELVSYLWNFGNDDTSADENPIYTYTGSGDFLASLTVTTTHGENTSAFVTITVEEFLNVTIALAQNWQWISLNILPVGSSMDAIFGGVADLGMVIDGSGNLYTSEIDEIGEWDVYSGYAVGMYGNGQISIDGEYLDPTTPIDVVAGWNFVSYFPDQDINVNEAVASIDGDGLAIVKSDAGTYYVPSLGINSLGTMEPTKGYKIGHWTGATLVYPEAQVAKLAQPTIATEPVHFQTGRRSGDSHAVLVSVDDLNNLSLQNGDEIGLFSGETCVGAAVYEGEKHTTIAAWKTENGATGYQNGEKIGVKVFSDGNETEVVTTESAYFGEGFFSVVGLTSAIIVSDFALHGNYPNPFNPSTKIVFDVSATADIDLTIYNIAGQEVRSLQNGQLDHGSYEITWDGLDNSGSMVSSGVYFYRMTWTAEEFSGQQTQKMVLLR